jgi:hypothetical protein
MSASKLLTAGCYVVRFLERPAGLGNGSLPDILLTLSGCLTEFFPDAWALEWTSYSESERLGCAAKLGKLGWPCVWNTLNDARAAVQLASLPANDFALVELGVPAALAPELLPQLKPAACDGPSGLYSALCRNESLEPGGVALGWELLGFETGGSLHSPVPWFPSLLRHHPWPPV